MFAVIGLEERVSPILQLGLRAEINSALWHGFQIAVAQRHL